MDQPARSAVRYVSAATVGLRCWLSPTLTAHRRREQIDARAQEDLLARMDARTKQRQEELALYRSRPDLVEPDLVFQPSINRSVPSTSRRISPVRSPMRRAEGRHLEQMAVSCHDIAGIWIAFF